MIQHPIYGMIMAMLMIVIVIINSIPKQQFSKVRLILAFLNLAIWIGCIPLYPFILDNNIYETVYLVYTALQYLIFIVSIYVILSQTIFKTQHYQLFVKAMKNSHWNAYYIVDHKERIKDMSTSLLSELNLQKDDVMGKKLMTVLNQSIRVIKRNDTELNNHMLEAYYDTYKHNVKIDAVETEELQIQNHNGEVIVLHFITQPIFSFDRYKGRICIGEKKTDLQLLSVEKHLNAANNELESLRHKFIATLELSEEGLFYIDLDDKLIWLNDSIVEKLELTEHEFTLEQYRQLIEPEDAKKYFTTISDLTKNKQTYLITYRIKTKDRYIWVREKGKRLFEDSRNAIIMGTLTALEGSHFRKSNIDVLDQIKDQDQLIVDMNGLIHKKREFQLAVLTLKNIPYINSQHGYSVGNLSMANYIQKIKQSFITESSNIYRLSGLEFAFTITDPRKMAGLKTGIMSQEKFFNLHMTYGSIQIEVEAFIGVATMHEDAKDPQELLMHAQQALKTAQHPNFKGQAIYYKDIQS